MSLDSSQDPVTITHISALTLGESRWEDSSSCQPHTALAEPRSSESYSIQQQPSPEALPYPLPVSFLNPACPWKTISCVMHRMTVKLAYQIILCIEITAAHINIWTANPAATWNTKRTGKQFGCCSAALNRSQKQSTARFPLPVRHPTAGKVLLLFHQKEKPGSHMGIRRVRVQDFLTS